MPLDINIAKQVEYWKNGSKEDIEVTRDLIAGNHIRHGMFFLHLSLEKILKAHVCKTIQDVPPRIHNLVRLAELAQLPLIHEQKYFLEEINNYNLEGRYPDVLTPVPDLQSAKEILARTEGLYQWLINQL
ncbi:MAG: HEPN domain-containing protein [Leptolinea sp.]